MMRAAKRALVGATFAGALALPMSLPADASPVITGGLVNVTVTDVLSGNKVTAQVPIDVAANICDVDVAVLSTDLMDGTANCSNTQKVITVSQIR